MFTSSCRRLLSCFLKLFHYHRGGKVPEKTIVGKECCTFFRKPMLHFFQETNASLFSGNQCFAFFKKQMLHFFKIIYLLFHTSDSTPRASLASHSEATRLLKLSKYCIQIFEENVKCKDLPVLHDILFSKIVRKRENKDLPVLHDISGQPCLVLGEKIHPGLDVLTYTGHQQLLHLAVHLDFH